MAPHEGGGGRGGRGNQLGSGDAGVDGVHVDGELWLLILVLRHVVNGGGVASAHVRVPHHLIETENWSERIFAWIC